MHCAYMYDRFRFPEMIGVVQEHPVLKTQNVERSTKLQRPHSCERRHGGTRGKTWPTRVVVQ